MSVEPLITVVVPVYNTAPWLKKCLDSICEQTYRHLEIICVDDGSTDGSADILREYAARDERVKLILQQNKGVSAARNVALNMAHGEYFTGVDSDDYIMPHAYETLIPHLEQGPDILCYGVMGVDEQGNDCTNDYMRVPCSGVVEPSADILSRTNGFFWNKLFRVELLREYHISFPEGMRYEDYMFNNIAAMQARCICYVEDALYCYLQRDSSFTNARVKLRAVDACPMLESLYRYMKEHGLFLRWKDWYYLAFMEFYENPVSWLSGSQQRKAKSLYRSMVIRTGLHREYPGEYPFSELVRYNVLRSLFFWRNKSLRLYKIFRWIILKVEEMPDGKKLYHWFP